jgi:anti-sigma B factor antagonist
MFASSEGRAGAIRVVSETDQIVAVCLEGEFDLANAPELGDQINRAVDGNDVILDLSEATFIDSSIVEVIVQASKRARKRDRSVVLQLGTAAVVERALHLTGVTELLPRVDDRQKAVRLIRAFRGAGG